MNWLIRALAALVATAGLLPLAAAPGQAISGTVDAGSYALNGSVKVGLAGATVNIASVAPSAYPAGPTSNSTASGGVAGAATVGAVTTTATGDPLADTAASTADVASLNVASGLVGAGPVSSTCTATGSGESGSATVTGLTLGGGLTGTIPTGTLAPNTTVPLTLGVASAGSIILNEQIPITGGGLQGLKVNALHIQITLASLATIDLTVGQSTCTTTIPATPAVTSISPVTGPTAGGTSVTITGTGFVGTNSVKFGSTNATSYTINSATSITAVAPAGSAGSTDIRVATATGTSANTAADDFTYIPHRPSPRSPPAPDPWPGVPA
jgi:IPT/TIG domain